MTFGSFASRIGSTAQLGVPLIFHLDETSAVTLGGSNLGSIKDNVQGIVFSSTGSIARTGVTENGIQCIGNF